MTGRRPSKRVLRHHRSRNVGSGFKRRRRAPFSIGSPHRLGEQGGDLADAERLAQDRHVRAQHTLQFLAFRIAGDEGDRQVRDGACASPARAAAPFMLGMAKSIRARSGTPLSSARMRGLRRGRWPRPRAPARSSSSVRKVRTSGSSSTTMIRAETVGLGRLGPSRRHGFGLSFRRGRLDMGQQHANDRALAFPALDPNGAAGLTGDAVDLGEAEAGALAERLGREKGFGCARGDLGGHAGAGVGDRDADIVAGRDIGCRPPPSPARWRW